MDCNRDDALKAKMVAESKFQEKDIAGAKRFAVKAQKLFPALEGIDQMIATFDVYLASESKINGEIDWYAILSVDASADEDTLKKQYRKLALQLHPDKSKSIGSEGAFKLISEAWSVLSDKSKRFLHDQKRKMKGFQQRTQKSTTHMTQPNKDRTQKSTTHMTQPNKDRTVPSTAANGFNNFANTNTASKAKAHKSTTNSVPSTATPFSSNSNTFWTSCYRCKMQYEYLRVYLNHNLLCPKCREPFLAEESTVPPNGPNPFVKQQQHSNLKDNSTVRNAFGPETKTTAASAVPDIRSSGFQHASLSEAAQAAYMTHQTNLKMPTARNAFGPETKASASAVPDIRSSGLSEAAQAANMTHQMYLKMRREREAAQAAAIRERMKNFGLGVKRDFTDIHYEGLGKNASDQERPSKLDGPTKKRRRSHDTGTGRGGVKAEHDIGTGRGGVKAEQLGTRTTGSDGISTLNSNAFASCKSRMTSGQNNLHRELSQLDIKSMLMEKANVAICKKFEEWKQIGAVDRSVEKQKAEKKQQQTDEEKIKDEFLTDATNQHMSNDSRSDNKKALGKKNFSNGHSADSGNEVFEPMEIDVPDPDFYDFDSDRSERSFEADQVWAIYDEEDGMPRYYALVQKVISVKSFKIRMSYLKSKSNSEFGPINWVGSGFAKTCGEFRVGKYEFNDAINMFSHRVRWDKCPRGVIKIVPQKSDIWALYRNWSPDWNELTPDDVIYKYDMVEVIDDYDEEQGVSVTPLVKVAGFSTVFHRHQDPKETKRIPKEEMFRFSHQVPFIVLTGEEGHNSPKGYYELDPAAVPKELLRVISDLKSDDVTRITVEGHNSPKGYYELDSAAVPKELLQVISDRKSDDVPRITEEQPVS